MLVVPLPVTTTSADRLTIRSLDDIRPAAEALHEMVMALARLRTAPCANIASKEPMVDATVQCSRWTCSAGRIPDRAGGRTRASP
jgi:hypothetical protein